MNGYLGSTSITADPVNGNKLTEMRYYPWGEERYANGTLNTTFRYTGQRQEEQLGGSEGLYYYGARWYDPVLGRFASPDTIVPEPYNPQDWDRYAYVRNNPLKYIDPSGHMPYEENGGIGYRRRDFDAYMTNWYHRNYRGFSGHVSNVSAQPSLNISTASQMSISGPFYDPNAIENSYLSGSAQLGIPQYQSEYSYDYDPLGNEIAIPLGNPAAWFLQAVDLGASLLGPFAPPETSAIDAYLFYSNYANGDVVFPGMSVVNNSSAPVIVDEVVISTANIKTLLSINNDLVIKIGNIVGPGQTERFSVNGQSHMPGFLEASTDLRVVIHGYGPLPYQIKFTK